MSDAVTDSTTTTTSVPLLDLRAQYASIREEVDAAMAAVVESQRFILGEPVARFEREAAAYLGVEHAVGCASGTDALLLALRALELEPGDEVVVPAFTFFATAGAVWNAGLRPAFCDVDPATYNATAETIEAALTDRTRAVIVVHLFGRMAEMAPILDLAERRGLTVIEDAAQAFGARQAVAGAPTSAGAAGALGCHSFFPTKNLGGFGDGGMVVTDDDALADRVRKLRVHGGVKMYHHEMVGTNSRLDALQAAVLSAKLPHVDRWLAARRENAAKYDEALADAAPAVRTPASAPGNEHTYNQYTPRVERRDALREYLQARGIGTGLYYPVPLHLQPCFAELGYAEGSLPVSEALCREVISLPVYAELDEAQVGAVIEGISSFYAGAAS
ncbi:MAG: DegT/DnrJ/EryC1/StrS family aminotransferase [Gemmatimonadota bacterium]